MDLSHPFLVKLLNKHIVLYRNFFGFIASFPPALTYLAVLGIGTFSGNIRVYTILFSSPEMIWYSLTQ